MAGFVGHDAARLGHFVQQRGVFPGGLVLPGFEQVDHEDEPEKFSEQRVTPHLEGVGPGLGSRIAAPDAGMGGLVIRHAPEDFPVFRRGLFRQRLIDELVRSLVVLHGADDGQSFLFHDVLLCPWVYPASPRLTSARTAQTFSFQRLLSYVAARGRSTGDVRYPFYMGMIWMEIRLALRDFETTV